MRSGGWSWREPAPNTGATHSMKRRSASSTVSRRDNAVVAGRWCADEGYTDSGARPQDAASIALFLASDEAANMTGQDINSGGGVMW